MTYKESKLKSDEHDSKGKLPRYRKRARDFTPMIELQDQKARTEKVAIPSKITAEATYVAKRPNSFEDNILM